MTEPAFVPGRTPPKRRPHPAVWGAIGAVVVLLAAGGVYLFTRPGGVAGESSQAQAIRLCEDSVRGDLKAPATARFSGESYEKTSTIGALVTGSVDAENGFGALLRTSFRCSLVVADGKWTVSDSTVADPQ